jgi:molybdopterin converting factor small subunit
MALVTVRFYSILRRVFGVDTLRLEAADVEELIAYLEREFGPLLKRELRINARMRDQCLFLLNGINVRNLKDKVLRDGDILHVFIAAAGG